MSCPGSRSHPAKRDVGTTPAALCAGNRDGTSIATRASETYIENGNYKFKRRMNTMKRNPQGPIAGLLLSVLFMSVPASTVAQFRIGARAGINVATLSISSGGGYWDESGISSYVGPAIGGIMQRAFSGPLFLRFEPM